MNNRNEVVQQIMEWSNMEALAHTLKKNNQRDLGEQYR